MTSLEQDLLNEETDNWILIYRIGLYETMSFIYGHYSIDIVEEYLNRP